MKCYCNTATAIEPKQLQVSVPRAASGLDVFRACCSCTWAQRAVGWGCRHSPVLESLAVFRERWAWSVPAGCGVWHLHSCQHTARHLCTRCAFRSKSLCTTKLSRSTAAHHSCWSHICPSSSLPISRPPALTSYRPCPATFKKMHIGSLLSKVTLNRRSEAPGLLHNAIPWSSPCEVPRLAMGHHAARKEEQVRVAQLSAVSREKITISERISDLQPVRTKGHKATTLCFWCVHQQQM